MCQGARKENGLGAYAMVSLSEAREKARQLKRDLANGINPHEVKHAKRRQALEERARSMTLEMAAQSSLELNVSSMTNDKHRKQWASTLQTYASRVGGTVTQVDRTTQHNATLVDQMAAATSSLKIQAHALVQVVVVFTLEPARARNYWSATDGSRLV